MPELDPNASHDFDPIAPEAHAWGRMSSGIGPGLIAGILMACDLAILAVGRGQSIAHPLRVIASTFVGSQAMSGGPSMVVLGAVIHFAMSAILGASFALFVGRTTRWRMLGLGLFYGVFLWGIAQFLILPLVNPGAAHQIGTIGTFFVAHLAYGLMLAACMPTVKEIDAPARGYIDPLRREVHP